jgi:hypothetical protein
MIYDKRLGRDGQTGIFVAHNLCSIDMTQSKTHMLRFVQMSRPCYECVTYCTVHGTMIVPRSPSRTKPTIWLITFAIHPTQSDDRSIA